MPRPPKPPLTARFIDTHLVGSQVKYHCTLCHDGTKLFDRSAMEKHFKGTRHCARMEEVDREDELKAAKRRRVYEARRPHPQTCVPGTDEPPVWQPDIDPPTPPPRTPSPPPDHLFTFLRTKSAPATRTPEEIAREVEWAWEDSRAARVADLERMRYREEYGDESEGGSDASGTAEEKLERDAELRQVNELLDKARGDCWPFANQASVLLNLLDASPGAPLSGKQLKKVIAFGKAILALQLHPSELPSYGSFRKTQKAVSELVHGEEPVIHITSRLGNHFSIVNPLIAFAKDFSNPNIAREIRKYPEVGGGPVTDVWEALRWHLFNRRLLNPMWADPRDNHYYIDEIAQCRDGRYVIPLKWVTVSGVVHAECLVLGQDVHTSALTMPRDETTTSRIPASELAKTYIQLQGEGIAPFSLSDASGPIPQMPHPTRIAAGGDEVYVIYVSIWADDVSGNNSKQYNKHVNVYATNGNLPGKLLSQEYCIKYLSSSKHAKVSEQMEAILGCMKSTAETPFRTFDSVKKRPCRLIIRVADLPCDNPQADELASHIHNGKDKCRRGKLGGMDAGETIEDRETDEMYEALHESCTHRSVEDIIAALDEQTEAAITTGKLANVAALHTSSGIKDHFASIWHAQICEQARIIAEGFVDPPPISSSFTSEMHDDYVRRYAEMKEAMLRDWCKKQPGDKYNPLLYVAGLNPAAHTAVEILHTYLLGIEKYVWHFVNRHLAAKKTQELFVQRLASSDCSGLKLAGVTAAYIWRYKDGLNGKHFKMLSQTMVFHLHDLVPPELFALVREVSILGGLLWRVRIDDMVEYKKHLSIAIGNMLDAFDAFRPCYIHIKMKLHCFAHLMNDIECFGPAIRKSTETFESFNKRWRNGCFLSNRHADSRDIAVRLTRSDAMAHLASGGYVFDKASGIWRTSGSYLPSAVKQHTVLSSDVGLRKEKVWTPGEIKALPAPKGVERLGVSTKDTGDSAKIGTWVAYEDQAGVVRWGRISDIERADMGKLGWVTVRNYCLGTQRHPNLRMPLLSDSAQDHRVSSKSVLFLASVQHDCPEAGCDTSAERVVLQEGRPTNLVEKVYCHTSDGHYILNTAAMHNIDHILDKLPPDLRYPVQTHDDRKAFHRQCAEEARKLGSQKRIATKKKSAETRARNKAAKDKQDAKDAGVPEVAAEVPEEVAEEDDSMDGSRKEKEQADDAEAENSAVESDDEEDEEEKEGEIVDKVAQPTRMRIRLVGPSSV